MSEAVMNGAAAAVGLLSDAQRRMATLAAENARLRAEAVDLRRRAGCGQYQRIIDRTHTDAQVILHYRAAGLDVGRRWLRDTGVMSERRYGWALALLRLARCDITPASIEHLDQCLRRVGQTVERLHADGDITALRARGNAHIRRRW